MAYVFEDKAACCGCGLCKAACPHQAITMTPDEEGFCYPVIDAQRCTNCGACRRICAYGQGPKEKPLAYYAARHQDADRVGAQLFRRRFFGDCELCAGTGRRCVWRGFQ